MPLFILIGGCLLTLYTNPYYFVQLNEGDGRLADERDVKNGVVERYVVRFGIVERQAYFKNEQLYVFVGDRRAGMRQNVGRRCAQHFGQ